MKVGGADDVEDFRREFVSFLAENSHLSVRTVGCARSAAGGLADLRRWQVCLFENGWLAPALPREFGGRRATPAQVVVYLRELSSRRIARSPNCDGIDLVASTLVRFGTAEQKERWALPILRGQSTAALVGVHNSEADQGPTDERFIAVRQGDEFVVNGYAICRQDAAVMMAQVGGHPGGRHTTGSNVLLIPLDTVGVVRKPLPDSSYQRVFVTEAHISDGCLIGPEGRGSEVLEPALTDTQSLAWFTAADRLDEIAEAVRPTNAEQRQRLATLIMDMYALRLLGAQCSGPSESSRIGLDVRLLALDAVGSAADLAMSAAFGVGWADPACVFGPLGAGGGPRNAGRFAATVYPSPLERPRAAVADALAAWLCTP